jgi:endoplasmic reticulum-Golgi intermediate compartment protein 3
VTLVAAAIILTFTSIEFFDYRRVNVDTSLLVDKSRGEKLTVKMNITFPRVPCYCKWNSFLHNLALNDARSSVLSLDVMDISGETQRDVTHNIFKTRLTDAGVPVPNAGSAELRNEIDKLNEQKAKDYCGSCYGGDPPEGGCCNTCDQVRQAYVNKGWSFGNPDGIEQVRSESSFGSGMKY